MESITFGDYTIKLIGNNEHRRNKTVNRDILRKVIEAFLARMDEHGDDTIPPQKKDLYEPAGVPRRSFDNNFPNIDSVLYEAERALLETVHGKVPRFYSNSTDLDFVLMIILMRCKSEPVLFEFAVRRFGLDFWEAILTPMREIILLPWRSETEPTRDYLFKQFASVFYVAVRSWREHGASDEELSKYINSLIALRKSLGDQIMYDRAICAQ